MKKTKYFLLIFSLLFVTVLLMGKNKPAENNPTLKVALLQLRPEGADVEANLKKGEEYCRKAKAMGADIAMFPEEWSIGYSRYHWPGTNLTPEQWPLSFEDWRALAVDRNSTFISHFRKLAAELKMAIIITYTEESGEHPKNSATVIDANGNLLMTYSKVHTSDFKATEANCTPGDGFYVCDMRVGSETVKLGVMICYDREQPESARILMLKGAEVILTPNACNLSDMQIRQFQVRAYENVVGVAMANYASPKYNGRSCAYDASGNELLLAGEDEDVFLVEFDLNQLREKRKNTIHGNAYRRPLKYKELISTNVDSIFIRTNGLGETFQPEKR